MKLREKISGGFLLRVWRKKTSPSSAPVLSTAGRKQSLNFVADLDLNPTRLLADIRLA